ncbi:dihydrofolate reductase [Proteiniclasticum sp. SCR006]|uniref:Dihydrofolate reductase n=1 Tax=Proteiniclasticum aestuarii TaxID=2817862 RepID=A0A939H5G9_9CLOT|nr:dihydrofolate reductase [Proteiniclasticum aestuarii]MBO1264587.1 dihydrofolate reductase [Proteiniclasticum aestuarii]
MLSLIVATTEEGVIGKEGTLIWRIPTDLRYFREKTMGKKMIMGRKTFESFPSPLPGREHIVLTRKKDYDVPEGVRLIHDFSEVDPYLESDEEVFIIGGGEIFRHFLPLCERLYITWVKKEFEGDTFFPVEEIRPFTEVKRETVFDVASGIEVDFTIYERKDSRSRAE